METTATQEKAKDPFQVWMESTSLPVYRGHSAALPSLELAWWPERECNAAFLELAGQEGVTEGRVTEIPPGKSLPPFRFAVDELVYVVDGQGTSKVWTDGMPPKTFEWQKYSLFVLPGGVWHQLNNMQGDRPCRLLHYSYLPLAMTTVADKKLLLECPLNNPDRIYAVDNPYSEAQQMMGRGWGSRTMARLWVGNFFPDMRAWDKLASQAGRGGSGRGAGAVGVQMRFPGSELSAHMSVFPPATYKKAHRHGPGRIIVIPQGEGYSLLWWEGQEKHVVEWEEASVFVPPDKWFHQHFNLGDVQARYLALHPAPQLSGYGEEVTNRGDQIEYPDEDPFVRNHFESELGKRGRASLMPEEAYNDYGYLFSRAIAADGA